MKHTKNKLLGVLLRITGKSSVHSTSVSWDYLQSKAWAQRHVYVSLEEIQSKVYHCQFSGDQATHSRDISMNFNKKSQGHLNLISSLIAKARVCCAGFGVDTFLFMSLWR